MILQEWSVINIMNKRILDFYKQTSLYTDLGLYKDFMKNQPDNIDELCILQRKQIIHPVIFYNPIIREQHDCFWEDMTTIPITQLKFEDELFPTAISMISELLRKYKEYHKERKANDKIHVTCRATAYLSLRNGKYKENEICYASNPLTLGLIASIRSLFMIFTFNE